MVEEDHLKMTCVCGHYKGRHWMTGKFQPYYRGKCTDPKCGCILFVGTTTGGVVENDH